MPSVKNADAFSFCFFKLNAGTIIVFLTYIRTFTPAHLLRWDIPFADYTIRIDSAIKRSQMHALEQSLYLNKSTTTKKTVYVITKDTESEQLCHRRTLCT